MMKISSRLAIVAIASLFFAGSALAQTAAPAAAPAATAPAKKAEKPRSAESLACSKEADDKNIHGKDRKKFMSQCKKDAKAKAGGASDTKK
jgi:invasion protein IalB